MGFPVQQNQCKACPWRKATVPERDIPGGYSEELHRGLRGTIAEPASLTALRDGHAMGMACHESPPGEERACAGWLHQQLGPGNNLLLRVLALDGRFDDVRVEGEQHETFEDTLPR